MNELLRETINAAERVVAGEDSRVRDYLERLLNSSGELQSGEDSERVYLAALLDFIGLHEESVRVLSDVPGAMSRNMEGMLAAARGQHEQARNILVEALPASTDSPVLRQQILANLAAVSLQAGSVGEAEGWIEAAAAAGQAGNPAVDVLIATVRASIASRRGDLPALRGAAALLKEASKSRLAELGTEHPQALAIVANMASAEIMLARADNSAVRLERAIDVLEVAAFRLAAEFGADHPQAKAAMANLVAARAEPASVDAAVLVTEQVTAEERKPTVPDHQGLAARLRARVIPLSTRETEESFRIRLIRPALAKMVAALRAVVGVAAITSALVGAIQPVSLAWLVPALAMVAIWTCLYVALAWTHDLRTWLIGTDVFIAAGLCLAIGKLVPPQALAGTDSWVALIASMTVVSAQLGDGMRVVTVPAGLFVAASIVVGQRLAHSPDGGVPAGILVATQTVVAAAVMAVALRTERNAARAFTQLQEAQAAAALASARREDERAQLRLVHNGPLTTLTMALHGGARRPSVVIRRRAEVALEALSQLTADPGVRNAAVRLDERLAQVVIWYEPLLRITADLQADSVPSDVAEAFVGATAEALENIVRYAGTDRATVQLCSQEGVVAATVTDQGRGFDQTQESAFGFGLREDLSGRMAAVGGVASVHSGAGAGTVVLLEWRRA